jgi:hypothetical protein
MILEPVRCVTDWLNDTAFGFNAKIAALPVDLGDERLLVTAPFIQDGSRDDRVLTQADPPKTPALYVNSDGPLNAEGEVKTIYRDADNVTVAIRYLIKNADTSEAATQTMYALRAIVRSIRDLMRNENVAARTRNSILIVSCSRITYGAIEETVGNTVATGAVVCVFVVRDKAP